MMLRFMAVPFIALGLALPAYAGTPPPDSRTLSLNGRVGSTFIGNTQTRTIRDYGQPSRVERIGERPPFTTVYAYFCGRGCYSRFYFDRRGLLSDFVTTSKSWRTLAGTRVGDRIEAAEALEGKSPRETCGNGISIEKTGRAFLLIAIPNVRTVSSLAVSGRNSVLDPC